jgi:hypothetical protein
VQPPQYWPDAAVTKLKAKQVGRVELEKSSPLFSLVRSMVNNAVQDHPHGHVNGKSPVEFSVEKVEISVQHVLWNAYVAQRDTIRSRWKAKKNVNVLPVNTLTDPEDAGVARKMGIASDVNEKFLFHGSRKEVLDEALLDQGYDHRVASETGMFGPGFYLAEHASKSSQYIPCPGCKQNCIQNRGRCTCGPDVEASHTFHLVVYRTCLGHAHVAKTYREDIYKKGRPPTLSPDDPMSHPLDSIVAEPIPRSLKFREFILYERHQAYPEFVVTFKRLSAPCPAPPLSLKEAYARVIPAMPRENPQFELPQFELREVTKEDSQADYNEAVRIFHEQRCETGRVWKTTEVYRIVNPPLEERFLKKEAELLSIYPSSKSVFAFHGTPKLDDIHKIAHKNYDIRMGKRGVYGAGLYFSEITDVSNDYASNVLLINRVCLGKVFEGGHDGQGLEPGYDSHRAPVHGHIVIFDKDQILPKYIVHYKPS